MSQLINWLFGESETSTPISTTIGLLTQTILRDLSNYQISGWEFSERGIANNDSGGCLYQVFRNTKRNYTLSTQLSNFSEKIVNIDEIHINPLTKYEQSLIFNQLIILNNCLSENKRTELRKVDESFLQKTFPECFSKKPILSGRSFRSNRWDM